jgi:magnesium-transporting ATPase (P-type)
VSAVGLLQAFGHEGFDGQAEQLAVAVAEHVLKPGAGRHDRAVAVGQCHSVLERFEQPSRRDRGRLSAVRWLADLPLGELGLAEAAVLSPEEVLARLGSGQAGLSSEDAAERLRTFGPNALGTHRVRATVVLLRQVRNPILVLLLGAALVSG